MDHLSVNDILYILFTACSTCLLRFLWLLISAKITDNRMESALKAVFTAVEYVNQTFVNVLKEEGNFDRKAQIKAFDKAKHAALEVMDTATQKWLEKKVSNQDAWLEIQIESTIKAVK